MLRQKIRSAILCYYSLHMLVSALRATAMCLTNKKIALLLGTAGFVLWHYIETQEHTGLTWAEYGPYWLLTILGCATRAHLTGGRGHSSAGNIAMIRGTMLRPANLKPRFGFPQLHLQLSSCKFHHRVSRELTAWEDSPGLVDWIKGNLSTTWT